MGRGPRHPGASFTARRRAPAASAGDRPIAPRWGWPAVSSPRAGRRVPRSPPQHAILDRGNSRRSPGMRSGLRPQPANISLTHRRRRRSRRCAAGRSLPAPSPQGSPAAVVLTGPSISVCPLPTEMPRVASLSAVNTSGTSRLCTPCHTALPQEKVATVRPARDERRSASICAITSRIGLTLGPRLARDKSAVPRFRDPTQIVRRESRNA